MLCFRYNRDPGPIAEVRTEIEAAETEAVATFLLVGAGSQKKGFSVWSG